MDRGIQAYRYSGGTVDSADKSLARPGRTLMFLSE